MPFCNEHELQLISGILGHIGDGVIMTDIYSNIVYINDAALDIVGVDEASALKQNFSEIFPIFRLDTGAVIKNLIERAILIGNVLGLEKNSVVQRTDGSYIYLSATCSPIRSPDQTITGVIVLLRNINRLRNLEERFQEESNTLKTIFNTSPIGIVMLDNSGTTTNLNQAALSMMRTEYADAIGQQFGDAFCCIHGLNQNIGCGHGGECRSCQIRQAIVQSLTESRSAAMETHMVFLQKSIEYKVWFKLTLSPVKIEGEKHVVITMLDITERKNREIEVEKSRDFHLRILASFPGMVWWKKGRDIVYINTTYEEFIGKPSDELIGSQWVSFVHSEDRFLYLKAFTHDSYFESEIRVLHHSGEYRWVWCINRPFYDMNGKADGTIGIGFDITDRKNMELAVEHNRSQYYSLFMNMHSGFTYNRILCDENNIAVDFQYVECNDDYKTLMNQVDQSLPGKRFSEIFPDCMPKYQEWILDIGNIAQAGIGRLDKEFYCHATHKWLSLSVYSFEKGYFAALFTDITQQKNSERQLTAAALAAESANAAKSQFLANMSHEIRTPINGMVGMIDLTLITQLTEEQKENLKIAKSCANSLLVLINDILDFSKMEAGKLLLETVGFDLRDLINDIVRTHAPKVKAKGLEFSYTLPADLSKAIVGDPTRLKQVIHNLVGNSLKFTHVGSISLQVKHTQDRNGTDSLIFSVEDTGIGIDEAGMQKLFKAFSQVDGSITRRFGGTGLGLMITKQLVEIMNGEIWVSSEAGKGSKFSFSLPYKEVTETTEEAHLPERTAEEITSQRLLLAEDDPINRLVIGKMLRELGYQADVAENGRKAVELFQLNKYNCILMDIQMPEMDGLEATERIRASEKDLQQHTPIIALTAYAIKGDRERFLAHGMDGYVSKPIKMAFLDQQIKAVLQQANDSKPSDDTTDITDILLYCNQELQPAEANAKEVNDSVNRLTELADDLLKSMEEADFDMVELNADAIKTTAQQFNMEAVKDLAFKIQMAMRRGDQNEASLQIAQLHELVNRLANG